MLGSSSTGSLPRPSSRARGRPARRDSSAVANYDAHMLAVELQPAVAAVW